MEGPDTVSRTEEMRIQAHCRAIFSSRYTEILDQSLRVTRFDRAEAEELVHEAFIDLVKSRTDLSQVLNLDGYLYQVLRNLHVSCLRRAQKHQHVDLSIAEYQPPTTPRIADQLELQDQLKKLCSFLCWRKESSRTASLLLLRSFWGLEPTEIMALAGIRRGSVDHLIWVARREARTYLASRGAIRMGRKHIPLSWGTNNNHADRPTDLDAQLLAMVCDARLGDCLLNARIEGLHPGTRRTSMTIMQLAHLVSCEDCLTESADQMKVTLPKRPQLSDIRRTDLESSSDHYAYQSPELTQQMSDLTRVILDTPRFDTPGFERQSPRVPLRALLRFLLLRCRSFFRRLL